MVVSTVLERNPELNFKETLDLDEVDMHTVEPPNNGHAHFNGPMQPFIERLSSFEDYFV